jgi:hypothetical protein
MDVTIETFRFYNWRFTVHEVSMIREIVQSCKGLSRFLVLALIENLASKWIGSISVMYPRSKRCWPNRWSSMQIENIHKGGKR